MVGLCGMVCYGEPVWYGMLGYGVVWYGGPVWKWEHLVRANSTNEAGRSSGGRRQLRIGWVPQYSGAFSSIVC